MESTVSPRGVVADYSYPPSPSYSARAQINSYSAPTKFPEDPDYEKAAYWHIVPSQDGWVRFTLENSYPAGLSWSLDVYDAESYGDMYYLEAGQTYVLAGWGYYAPSPSSVVLTLQVSDFASEYEVLQAAYTQTAIVGTNSGAPDYDPLPGYDFYWSQDRGSSLIVIPPSSTLGTYSLENGYISDPPSSVFRDLLLRVTKNPYSMELNSRYWPQGGQGGSETEVPGIDYGDPYGSTVGDLSFSYGKPLGYPLHDGENYELTLGGSYSSPADRVHVLAYSLYAYTFFDKYWVTNDYSGAIGTGRRVIYSYASRTALQMESQRISIPDLGVSVSDYPPASGGPIVSDGEIQLISASVKIDYEDHDHEYGWYNSGGIPETRDGLHAEIQMNIAEVDPENPVGSYPSISEIGEELAVFSCADASSDWVELDPAWLTKEVALIPIPTAVLDDAVAPDGEFYMEFSGALAMRLEISHPEYRTLLPPPFPEVPGSVIDGSFELDRARFT